MLRRLFTGAVAGVLVFATALLVVLALRPDAPPRAPSAPLDIGAVEMVGDTSWRWVGPSDCNPDTDIIQLQTRTGDGEWIGLRIPLVAVYGITFSDNGEYGVAYGTSASCVRQIAVTNNGGRTWRTDDRNPVLTDAWWVDQRIWGVSTTSGATTVQAYRMLDGRGGLRLAQEGRVLGASPCDALDGPPSKVAFYTERVGLLLCEQRITSGRLIARTVNAGADFERLTDSRPESGLDGDGTVNDFEIAGDEDVWVLFSGNPQCPEGQLRFSDTQGQFFERLPCLKPALDVSEIFSVAFSDPENGIMLAASHNNPLMLTTMDGGQTWTPAN